MTIRRVEVAPERLAGWLARFAERHGPATYNAGPELVEVACPDGATACIAVPFPPLDATPGDPPARLVAHATTPRPVGLLLVRRGGVAAGVADGAKLATSKVATRYVQGRTAAGGWSQQRFARRREKQTAELVDVAAELAAAILLPERDRLTAIVTGGDRQLLRRVLQDRRLAPLQGLVAERVLDVPDPRHAVLEEAATRARSVVIEIHEPADTRRVAE